MTYRCIAKGGRDFRNTEFFVFEGDKVKRIDVYFGATYDNGAFVKQPALPAGMTNKGPSYFQNNFQ